MYIELVCDVGREERLYIRHQVMSSRHRFHARLQNMHSLFMWYLERLKQLKASVCDSRRSNVLLTKAIPPPSIDINIRLMFAYSE